MLMMLWLLVGFTSRADTTEFESSPKGCGRYLVAGIVQQNQGFGVTVFVNQGTQSEYRFTPARGELAGFYGFLDFPVSLELSIIRLNGRTGEVAEAQDMRLLAPNPMNPKKSNGFKLIQGWPCKK
ncbi:MAG: hypothetical protein WCH11_03065 [Bdellovibrio sp.]